MSILIGYDILLYYLLRSNFVDGIDILFHWITRIKADKYIDIASMTVLTNFVSTKEFSRLQSFKLIKEVPLLSDEIKLISKQINEDLHILENRNTLFQLNLLFQEKVDYLITENQVIHNTASFLGIDTRVYTIEDFIEKCCIENRNLDDSKGIRIQTVKFKTLDINNPFFKTFIKEYDPYYSKWFKKKANDDVYVAFDETENIRAILKLKEEFYDEDYRDIVPCFSMAKRLKICSLKVDFTGQKIGERFMRIIFDRALTNKVDEIYITIVVNSSIRRRLVNLIERWGFSFHGYKQTKEQVYVRKMNYKLNNSPIQNYPFQTIEAKTFIVPIDNVYAQLLLPNIEKTQYPQDFEPYKSAIKKVLILNKKIGTEQIHPNCNLLFYRLSPQQEECGIFASGIVDGIYKRFESDKEFLLRCRKRSCLTNEAINNYWDSETSPILVNFLYNYSFDNHVITDKTLASSGLNTVRLKMNEIIPLSKEQFRKIINKTKYEQDIIID